jgi:hypothetical protein
MRDLAWRMGFTVTALALLTTLGLDTSFDAARHLLERALGKAPEAQVMRYLDAICRGDRQAALSRWPSPATPDSALEARRVSITDELLGYGPDLQYQMLAVEWWRTCCEPAVIDDPGEAGGARIRVAIRRQGRPQTIYFFDLLVPGGYWGATAGAPAHRWTLVDVYPEGAAPIAWPWR